MASRACEPPVGVEADPPLGVEAVPLARHRHVLRAREPEPDRAPGERGPERRDGREPVRLHLLAAEPAAHPQALHGDVVVVEAEHVGDDLLRLGGVLGAALHEDLAVLVDQGQRRVRLEVEVLLPSHLGHAAEDLRRAGQTTLDVAAGDHRLSALEARGADRLRQRHDRGQRLVVDLHCRGSETGRLERLSEHPADGVADEHHLIREERLVVLHPGVVDARHVRRRQHPDHAGHRERGRGVEPGHPGVCVR